MERDVKKLAAVVALDTLDVDMELREHEPKETFENVSSVRFGTKWESPYKVGKIIQYY